MPTVWWFIFNPHLQNGVGAVDCRWSLEETAQMGLVNFMNAAIGDFASENSDRVAILTNAIDAHIECWFLQVLQLDARTLRLEALEIKDEWPLCG